MEEERKGMRQVGREGEKEKGRETGVEAGNQGWRQESKQGISQEGREKGRQGRRETEAGSAPARAQLAGGVADCYLHLCSMRHFPNCLQEGIVNTQGFIFVRVNL